MKKPNWIKTALTAAAAAAALGMLAPVAHADNCALSGELKATMTGSEAADLLRSGKFAELEANLDKRHKKNLSSEGTDLLTLRNIDELLQMSRREENLMRMWAGERPESFFAQLTAGIFYADQAAYARGDRAISQTGKNQLKQMSELDEKAEGYVKKAMQLDPRSTLPHGVMIVIAGQEGKADGKTAEQWLQAANQVDPKNLAARIQAVNFLSPRWGGSYELLDQIAQQASKSLPAKEAHYLEYTVVMAKASHEEVIAKNKAKANELYKRAKSMCENSETAQDGVIRTYP